MKQDRYQKLCQLFEQLIEADPLTQNQKIEELAKSDASLAEELKALLDADRAASNNSFLGDELFELTRTVSPDLLASSDVSAAPKSVLSDQVMPKSNMVGQYQLKKQLGAGGMGVVYLADDTIAKRSVAIKLIRPGLDHDEETRSRTINEAHAAAKLSHPNIVPVFDVGTDDNTFFFTMPLLESGDLKSADQFRYRHPEATADLFCQIASGLVHAHEQGIIHRDIKPSNILLDDNGSPMIADFGLAKNRENRELHTETGRLMGSANYMSPEQISDAKNVTELSDMYSFGATLYESLTGKPPFEGADLIELFQKISNRKPDKPSELNPDVDPRLESICLRCLEKEPEKRYSSMQTVLAELERVAEGKPLSDRSGIWKSFSDVTGFRQRGNTELKTQGSAVWVFGHNLILHSLVWVLVMVAAPPIYLWLLVGLGTIHLGFINWRFHWSRYWHLELSERLSAINLLMLNLCFVSMLFIHGPKTTDASVEEFVDAYPAFGLIFAVALAAHGSVHAGKWLTFAIAFMPVAVLLGYTDNYAPLVFALTTSFATLAIVIDLGAHGKKSKLENHR